MHWTKVSNNSVFDISLIRMACIKLSLMSFLDRYNSRKLLTMVPVRQSECACVTTVIQTTKLSGCHPNPVGAANVVMTKLCPGQQKISGIK